MKLWIFSDLHLESQAPPPDLLPPPEADVCVIAGDTMHGLTKAMDWAERFVAPHMPVVMVPGNHEFYGSSVRGELADAALGGGMTRGRVHVLSDRRVVIGGVRFVGATLWTDYALHAYDIVERNARDREVAWAMRNAAGLMPDHSAIRGSGASDEKWLPEHARKAHFHSLQYLNWRLSQHFPGPTVVVTHHAPSPKSVHPSFDGHPISPAYASDLKGFMWRRRPDLWIHGHVHNSSDYEEGVTRVLCNPRGFGNENPGFDPHLVAEVTHER